MSKVDDYLSYLKEKEALRKQEVQEQVDRYRRCEVMLLRQIIEKHEYKGTNGQESRG